LQDQQKPENSATMLARFKEKKTQRPKKKDKLEWEKGKKRKPPQKMEMERKQREERTSRQQH
jgi:hypothetical protein